MEDNILDLPENDENDKVFKALVSLYIGDTNFIFSCINHEVFGLVPFLLHYIFSKKIRRLYISLH